MNNFQEDDYHMWKIKLQLAKEGNVQAVEQFQNHLKPHIDSDHSFATANYTQLLKDANIHLLKQDQTCSAQELYSKLPLFFLLQGKAAIQCINTEGDNQVICSIDKIGLLQLNQTQLKIKYGQSNISLLTQFQVLAQKKSIVIEFSRKSIESKEITSSQQTTMRQESIMRKYMLIALKHITKLTYNKSTPVTNKFYLLQGRACYINQSKLIISCYQEGFFNPHPQNSNYTLYIFEGAYIMLLEQQMLKDEVVLGLQAKRKQHLETIESKYDKMTGEQRQKVQNLLISKYGLNRQEVNKQIYGIQQKPVQKFNKSKNDFIRTSSSMKDKCGIRIRKSKKVN